MYTGDEKWRHGQQIRTSYKWRNTSEQSRPRPDKNTRSRHTVQEQWIIRRRYRNILENENSIEDQGLPEPTNSKYIPEVGMQFKMRQNISAMSMLVWQDSLCLLLALIGQ